jgi:hypothetical protein
MKRFVIRNYGPSRQFDFKGNQIVMNHDGSVETSDEELTRYLGDQEQIEVTDRGIELALPSEPEAEESREERQVTADNPEALHRENHPDEDEGEEDSVEEEDQGRSVELEREDEELSYGKLTVPELRELCKDRQISATGLLKNDLVEALQAYDTVEV